MLHPVRAERTRPKANRPLSGPRVAPWLALATFLSGVAALVYQLLWTRQLGLVLGNTVGAVSTVLATFMGGLALGSALAAGRADRLPRRVAPGRTRASRWASPRSASSFRCCADGRPAGRAPPAQRRGRARAAGRRARGPLGGGAAAPATLMGATLPVPWPRCARPTPRAWRAPRARCTPPTPPARCWGAWARCWCCCPRWACAARCWRRPRSTCSRRAGRAGSRASGRDRARRAGPGGAAPAAARAPGGAGRARAGLRGAGGPRALGPGRAGRRGGLDACARAAHRTHGLRVRVHPHGGDRRAGAGQRRCGASVGDRLRRPLTGAGAGPGDGRRRRPGGRARRGRAATHGGGAGARQRRPHGPADEHRVRRRRRAAAAARAVLRSELPPRAARVARPAVRRGAWWGRAPPPTRRARWPARWLAGLRRAARARDARHAAGGGRRQCRGGGPGRAGSSPLAARARGWPWRRPPWRSAPPLAWLAGEWDRELLAGGAYKYAAYVAPERLEYELRAGELVFYREGRAATISVKRLGGRLSLAVDGKVDATSATDMLDAAPAGPPAAAPARLGALGLHHRPGQRRHRRLRAGAPRAQRGGGRDLARGGGGASQLFAHVNRDCAADPRLRVVVADGRNHLLLTPRRYDVIISEPSNPWMAGVGPLFTREFFAPGPLAPGAGRRDLPVGARLQHAHGGPAHDRGRVHRRVPVGGAVPGQRGRRAAPGRAGELPQPDPHARAPHGAPAVREDLDGVEVRTVRPGQPVRARPARPRRLGAGRAAAHRRPAAAGVAAPRSLHADTSRANREEIDRVAAAAHRARALPATLLGDPRAARVERARMLERAGAPPGRARSRARGGARARSLAALEGWCARRWCWPGGGGRSRAAADGRREPPVSARIALALLFQNPDRPAEALDVLGGGRAARPRLARPADRRGDAGGERQPRRRGGPGARRLPLAPDDADARALVAARFSTGRAGRGARRAERR